MNDQPMHYVVTTPTAWKLIKSTMLALVIAAALLVTVILRAEYAIDPTVTLPQIQWRVTSNSLKLKPVAIDIDASH